jgi:hypothetical protein
MKFTITSKFIIIILTLLPQLILAQQAPYSPVYPEPFRLDELEGRTDFTYGETSFLQRFTYQPRRERLIAWNNKPEGFWGTWGSTRATELLSVYELRKEFRLEEKFYFYFQSRRNEDFDSRYDRNLLGAGYQFAEKWKAAVASDLDAEKSELDIFYDLIWRKTKNLNAKFTIVQVDPFFNEKSIRGEYKSQPYTFFTEINAPLFTTLLPFKLQSRWWINWNPKLNLYLNNDKLTNTNSPISEFTYDQLSLGSTLTLLINPNLNIDLQGSHERGNRENQNFTTEKISPFKIDRSVTTLQTQINYQLRSDLVPWVGVRYFRFSEQGNYRSDIYNLNYEERREVILHFGSLMRISDSFLFSPGIYLNMIDNNIVGIPIVANSTLERSQTDSGTSGKITLPFEYKFTGNYEAYITFNPTLEFPSSIFGGGNIQLQVFF